MNILNLTKIMYFLNDGGWGVLKSYHQYLKRAISSFRREVHIDENCAVLGYHTARSGNFLLTLPDNLSVLPSRVTNPIY